MSSRNLDARAAQGSASASAAQVEVRPEKRGRFEVWPEQTISYNDWLALPKAPVGHLEFLRNNGLLESSRNRIANIDMTTARRPAPDPAMEAHFDAVPMPTQASVAALVASGVAPDAATAVLRQYSSALSALTTLRGSLLGLGKVIGMDGEGGGHGSVATTGRPPLPAMGQGSSSSASAVSNTDAMTVIHRDDPHEPSGSVSYVRGESISALPQTVPAPPPPLQRTYSALSSGTVASAMNDTSSEVGPRAAAGSVVTPGASGTSAMSELDRLRADLEASRQSKSKLLQDNKALQEKLEKTANELTVTQQKLRRIGVQA